MLNILSKCLIGLTLILAVALGIKTYEYNALETSYNNIVKSNASISALAIAKSESVAIIAKVNNDENKSTRRNIDSAYANYSRLRIESKPIAPPSHNNNAGCIAEFDRYRADTVTAISKFNDGVIAILKRGDEAIADLNTAKEWTKGL